MKILFRTFILLLAFLGVLSLLLEFNGTEIEVFTAEELTNLSKSSNDHLSELLNDIVIFWSAIVFLEAVSLMGLYLFWPPARFLFIFVVLVTYLVSPPLTRNYNIAGTTFEISLIAIEFSILLLSYTQPIRELFEKKS